jgi:hypothetical protein
MARGKKPGPHPTWTEARIQELNDALLKYIDETEVPIVSEFAYRNKINRTQIYEMPIISDTIKLLITKKEAQLEKGLLGGAIPPSAGIFSLKQLGWKDTQDVAVSGKVTIIDDIPKK